ncbi:hypothetical protein M0R45_002357 [Rubus argutus]|uniref:Uncharacterized protein n=1 Tax=Rubus argutus TaxID=59490 RepID=A0AAW1VHH9_RUBAR
MLLSVPHGFSSLSFSQELTQPLLHPQILFATSPAQFVQLLTVNVELLTASSSAIDPLPPSKSPSPISHSRRRRSESPCFTVELLCSNSPCPSPLAATGVVTKHRIDLPVSQPSPPPRKATKPVLIHLIAAISLRRCCHPAPLSCEPILCRRLHFTAPTAPPRP